MKRYSLIMKSRSPLIATLVGVLGTTAWADGDLDILATSKVGAIAGAMVVGLDEFVFNTPFEVQGFDTPLKVTDSITQSGATAGGRAVSTATAIPGGFKVVVETSGSAVIDDCEPCYFVIGQSGVATIVGFELTETTRLRMTGAGVPDAGVVQIRLETESQVWLDEQCDTLAGECPTGRLDVTFDEVLPPGQYGLSLAASAVAGLECAPPCRNGMFDALSTWNLCVETDAAPSDCPADADGDGDVGFSDVLLVLANWGCHPSEGTCADPNADVDGDDEVGFGDVLTILGAWGPCP